MYVCMLCMYVCDTDGSACKVFEDSHLHHAIQLGQQRQCGSHGRVPGLIDIRHCSTDNAAIAVTGITGITGIGTGIALLSGCFALVRRMQLALVGFQNVRVRQVTIHTYIHTYIYTYIPYIHLMKSNRGTYIHT